MFGVLFDDYANCFNRILWGITSPKFMMSLFNTIAYIPLGVFLVALGQLGQHFLLGPFQIFYFFCLETDGSHTYGELVL